MVVELGSDRTRRSDSGSWSRHSSCSRRSGSCNDGSRIVILWWTKSVPSKSLLPEIELLVFTYFYSAKHENVTLSSEFWKIDQKFDCTVFIKR